jgi:hypothetical protein
LDEQTQEFFDFTLNSNIPRKHQPVVLELFKRSPFFILPHKSSNPLEVPASSPRVLEQESTTDEVLYLCCTDGAHEVVWPRLSADPV